MSNTKTEAVVPVAEMQAWNRKLARYPEEIREEVLLATAEEIVGEAEVNAPVRSGDLKASHFVDDFEDGGVTIGAGGSGVDYAQVVHEVHPTKAHWFRDAIIRRFKPTIERALRFALEDRGMTP